MLVIGVKHAKIKEFNDPYSQCPHCSNFGIDYIITQKYLHFFWIPLFPVSRKLIDSSCDECGNFADVNKMMEVLENSRTPIYLFSGLFIIIALIALAFYLEKESVEHRKQYLANPKVNDVYTIEERIDNKKHYYFIKVNNIEADSLLFYRNQITYDKYPLSLVLGDYFVGDSVLIFLKSELEKMNQEGKISYIQRNYDSSDGFFLEYHYQTTDSSVSGE